MKTNTHERDKNITFQDEGHKYIIGEGDQSNYISVTNFVKNQFPTFEPDYIINKMKASPKWPESKYYGMTNEEIKELWNNSGNKAKAEGTGLHNSIDLYFKEELETEPESIEWSYFKQFLNNFDDEPYRSEWMIYDEDSKICGTLDFIAKNKDGTYTIVDWKRSKNISEPSTIFMTNTTYWHYALQLNLYQYILERHYNMKITKLLIVQMHPDTGLKIYKMPNLQGKLSKLLRQRRLKLHNEEILKKVKDIIIEEVI